MAVASALPAPAGEELACKSAVAICSEFRAESFLVTTHMDRPARRLTAQRLPTAQDSSPSEVEVQSLVRSIPEAFAAPVRIRPPVQRLNVAQ